MTVAPAHLDLDQEGGPDQINHQVLRAHTTVMTPNLLLSSVIKTHQSPSITVIKTGQIMTMIQIQNLDQEITIAKLSLIYGKTIQTFMEYADQQDPDENQKDSK